MLRSRQANENCFNDLYLSLAAVPTKGSGEGAKQLVAGSITSRQSLPGAELIIESGSKAVANETFGTIQGRKDFVLSVVVPDYQRGIRARVLSNSKTVAERKLQLLPPLSSLANATIHIIPNSHNDIAWLDSPEITADWRRDMVIGPAIPLLEKYPDYRYGMETTLFLIEYLHRAPFQAEKIRKLTAEGRLGVGRYLQPALSVTLAWRKPGSSVVLRPEMDAREPWAGGGLRHRLGNRCPFRHHADASDSRKVRGEILDAGSISTWSLQLVQPRRIEDCCRFPRNVWAAVGVYRALPTS